MGGPQKIGRSDTAASLVRGLIIFVLLTDAAAVIYGGFILTIAAQMSYAVDGKSSSTVTAAVITAGSLALAGLAVGVVATLRLWRDSTRWPLPYLYAVAAIHLSVGAIGLVKGYV